MLSTPYFDALRQAIEEEGGLYNAHLHLDRSGTMELEKGADGRSCLSLSAKHHLIPSIHAGPAYEPERLYERMNHWLDLLEEAGTTRAATVVDVTADRVRLSAFEVFKRLRQERKGRLTLEIGAYSPLGFVDSEPERWELIEQAAPDADFIGSLPERDDQNAYPDHIGYKEHCRRVIDLAYRLQKPVHVHVDQRNEPSDAGSEMLLDVLDEFGASKSGSEEPWVWMVHLISPSTYSQERFDALVKRMVAHHVGVICCPSAAISMRQFRPVQTPTYNSIARILDLLAAGIPVRVGSDNMCDVTSPAGTPDLMAEIYVLCNAMRFYDLRINAKLAAGQPLNAAEIEQIQKHLKEDAEEVQRVLQQIS